MGSHEPRDAHWSFVDPVQVRLKAILLTEGDPGLARFLEEIARESVEFLEAWFRDRGVDGNRNFRRLNDPRYRMVPMDALLHGRILRIVNMIGPRAWEDVVHHVVMQRLGVRTRERGKEHEEVVVGIVPIGVGRARPER